MTVPPRQSRWPAHGVIKACRGEESVAVDSHMEAPPAQHISADTVCGLVCIYVVRKHGPPLSNVMQVPSGGHCKFFLSIMHLDLPLCHDSSAWYSVSDYSVTVLFMYVMSAVFKICIHNMSQYAIHWSFRLIHLMSVWPFYVYNL